VRLDPIPLVLLLLSLAGCPRPEPSPPARVAAPAEQVEEARPTRTPWFEPPGPIVEAGSGLEVSLPEGWQVRPGRGAFPWEARDSATGAVVFLGTWTGNEAELQQRYDDRPLGFAARGTNARIEAVSDGPPWIASRESPDGLRVGWYLTVDGRPVAIEAVLPAAQTEAAWRAVNAVFDGLRRGVAGT
jgi:hypothetical protein